MAKTKIFKIPSASFSMQYLYSLLITELQSGIDGWELIRNEGFPYGAVFKVPNFKEGEYGYAGLMYKDIKKGESYWNWLKENIETEFVYNPEGFSKGRGYLFEANNGVVDGLIIEHKQKTSLIYNGNPAIPASVTERIKLMQWKTKTEYVYDNQGAVKSIKIYLLIENEELKRDTSDNSGCSFSPLPEIFFRDADTVFFTMFKQYEDTFDWKEMMGNYRPNYKAKPLVFYASKDRNKHSLMDPPVYPGTGCPALGAAPDFFSVNNPDSTVVVYLTKSKHNASLVINVNDYWDYAQIGFFDAFQGDCEYSYPAMAASSMSGILPLAELFEYGSEGRKVQENFQFDYTHKNLNMSHGIPLFSASYNSTGLLSQVQAMIPNGAWKSFYNFNIWQDSYLNKDWKYYWLSYNSPVEPAKLVTDYYIWPTMEECQGLVNSMPTMLNHQMDYAISAGNIDDMAEKRNKEEYSFIPVYMGFINNQERGIIGIIPRLYYCSRQVTRYGLYKGADNKAYLIIPNCHERRRWTYKSFYCALQGESQSMERMLSEQVRIDKMSESMNMAIELGELED